MTGVIEEIFFGGGGGGGGGVEIFDSRIFWVGKFGKYSFLGHLI